MSEENYIPASQTVHTTLEHEQDMLEAALNIHLKNKPERLIDDTVNRLFHQLFRDTLGKAPTGTYTEP